MTNQDAENAVRLYSDTVYKIAYARTLNKADADDIYQEVFLRYVKKNPVFNNEEHRKAWLIRVTINCSAKFAKQKAKSIPTENIESESVTEFSGESHAELLEALNSLPIKYREVIHLFYFEDMPTEKIAEVLRRRQSTVLSQLSRARKMMKDFLEEE